MNKFLQVLRNLFNKKQGPGYLSGINFKGGVKAFGVELYKGVTIVYLERPGGDKTFVYHFFFKKEFFYELGYSLEEIKELAHQRVLSLK